MVSLVLGGTGMVGSSIVEHLTNVGEIVIPVSRHPRRGEYFGDLTKPETFRFPTCNTIFCAANPRTFSQTLPRLLEATCPQRIVVISSTSVFSKLHSSDLEERRSINELVQAEKTISGLCERVGVSWTIVRPTLIYKEGYDRNITQIARLIQKLKIMPLYGSASGLRQPVHAKDLAIGAIAAAHSSKAANRTYCTTALETLTYREMAGRVFDALSMPRRLVSLSPIAWKAALLVSRHLYPNVTAVMGERMLKDLAFDSSAAVEDFGWKTRNFRPNFDRK